MKQYAIDSIKKAAKRLIPFQKTTDSFNIIELACWNAARDTALLYEKDFLTVDAYETDLDLLTRCCELSPPHGLCLEFGVATGRTLRHIAAHRPGPVFGFDSFQGLPEDWRTGFARGAFADQLPSVPANVTLVKGWFDATLPEFLRDNPGPVAHLHVDCDLYSSTRTILDLLAPRIVAGTIIVFDEYWNYPGWKEHEYKAFEEFKAAHSCQVKPIGFVPDHQQVAFVVTHSS